MTEEVAYVDDRPCTHRDAVEGLCPACGHCSHEVLLNGTCFLCGAAPQPSNWIEPTPHSLVGSAAHPGKAGVIEPGALLRKKR